MAYAFRPNAVTEIAGQALTAAQAGLQTLEIGLGLGCHVLEIGKARRRVGHQHQI